MLQIRERLVDLIVAITLRNQIFQLDPAQLRHLEHFFDVVGLPALHAGDGDLPRDEVAAADRKRPAA